MGKGKTQEPPAAITLVKEEPLDRKTVYKSHKPITLGYWKIRGLAQPVRYLLEHIEHPWEDTTYEQGDAPTYSIECWTSVKNTLGLDFPNIPYLIDPNEDVRITDTLAIMTYLCTKYAPELLGSSIEVRAETDMLYSHLKDAKQAVTGPCYVGMDRTKLTNLALSKMAPIVKYLGDKKDFLCGELTYIDFYCLELCDFVQFLTNNRFYEQNQAVARYAKRMKDLPNIKAYIVSERYLAAPCNNKVAKINNLD